MPRRTRSHLDPSMLNPVVEGKIFLPILITCPNTGRPLSTGMVMDRRSFASSVLLNNSVGPCPHCGQIHSWSKEQAYLEGDRPPRPHQQTPSQGIEWGADVKRRAVDDFNRKNP